MVFCSTTPLLLTDSRGIEPGYLIKRTGRSLSQFFMVCNRQAHRQMSARLHLTKKDLCDSDLRHVGWLVGDKVGAQSGKSQQVVGRADGEADDAQAGLEKSAHERPLLRVAIRANGDHDDEIVLAGGREKRRHILFFEIGGKGQALDVV